jgi:hypothetical protein
MSKHKLKRLTPAKEKRLVTAICLVNDFFTEHGLPAPIDQSASLVICRASEQQGPEMTRALIRRLIRLEPKSPSRFIN